MADYKAPLRDIRFVLNEVFEADKLWQSLPGLDGAIDAETADAMLEEAGKITSQTIAPLNRSGDEEGAKWDNGGVWWPGHAQDARRAGRGNGLRRQQQLCALPCLDRWLLPGAGRPW